MSSLLKLLLQRDMHHFRLQLDGKSEFMDFAEFNMRGCSNFLQEEATDILTDITTSYTDENPKWGNHWFIVNWK